MSLTSDADLQVNPNKVINDFLKDSAVFLEEEITAKSAMIELFKKILTINPDDQITQEKIISLKEELHVLIKDLLELRKDSDFTMSDVKSIIKSEGWCPDCGKTLEDVTLVGPFDRAQTKKKKKREFNFNETIQDWGDVVKEVRFKAFTHSSSFVGNVRYDQDNQSMVMLLNGESYDFCNVPERKFDVLEGATSLGKAFNDVIKGQHDC